MSRSSDAAGARNISVQTTNPQLRCRCSTTVLQGAEVFGMLYDGHVEMNGQVVCCKNVNDGAELERTINDLAGYLPFLRSVSVGAAGISPSSGTACSHRTVYKEKRRGCD